MKNKNILKLGIIFFSIDLLFIILHVFLGSSYGMFNLDWERNLPTIYQSLKLVIAGALFISSSIICSLIIKEKKLRFFFITLGIALILLGFDEAAEIHETIPFYLKQLQEGLFSGFEQIFYKFGYQSSVWILYVILTLPFVIDWAIYILPFIYKEQKKFTFKLIGALSIFFIGAIAFEFIGTLNEVFFSQNYYWIMIIEETFELVGGTLILLLGTEEVLNYYKSIKKKIS